MNRKLTIARAVLVTGLVALASNASAALVYFDAQIVDIPTGKTTVPRNTVMCAPNNNCAEIPFTSAPHDPTTNPTGNWTQNNANPIPPGTGTGNDNAWNQRFQTPAPGTFGNPDASGNGTVYESRGQFDGGGADPNTEDPRVLKTTISVAPGDQGTLAGVYALFWVDTSNWQLAACLECVQDERMPTYYGGTHEPAGYVFGVYDVGAGDPNNFSPLDLEMNGFTTTDGAGNPNSGSNRRLKAAWLGNVVLGQALTVFVGDGPAMPDDTTGGSHNSRAWYDGIAYGDVQDLQPLACIPEPGSFVLLGIALSGFGLIRRR